MSIKIAVIGAGPAGLSFADKLIQLSPNAKIHIFEKSSHIGGISRTIEYKNNKIDIGGHRFFSKSDEVMKWWTDKFPIDIKSYEENLSITYQSSFRDLKGLKVANESNRRSGKVFLLRNRKSRVLYKGFLYDYPISLNIQFLKNIGFKKVLNIIFSYFLAKILSRKINNLEDFIISKFGKKLYQMFFESYTKKVWGRHPSKISASWGTQRIKGVSIRKIIFNILDKIFSKFSINIFSNTREISLIEQFLYPKYGPGQIWQEVGSELKNKGVKIFKNTCIENIILNSDDMKFVLEFVNENNPQEKYDYLISTIPIPELVSGLKNREGLHIFSQKSLEISSGLPFRDFITVGILLDSINGPKGQELNDTWLYIQDSDVLLGRIQIFNNWSPYLVEDQSKIWLGLEYFCDKNDFLWSKNDQDILEFAKEELLKIGLIKSSNFIDGVVYRQEKAYPGYFDSYSDFDIIRKEIDSINGLFVIGRNGMHRYNNQDHSMLTGFRAAELIASKKFNSKNKSQLWEINTQDEYNETDRVK